MQVRSIITGDCGDGDCDDGDHDADSVDIYDSGNTDVVDILDNMDTDSDNTCDLGNTLDTLGNAIDCHDACADQIEC